MRIIKYLEHNNEKFFEGERVILNKYNKPELICTVDFINDDKFCPQIVVVPNDGGPVVIKLHEIESIRKDTCKLK